MIIPIWTNQWREMCMKKLQLVTYAQKIIMYSRSIILPPLI